MPKGIGYGKKRGAKKASRRSTGGAVVTRGVKKLHRKMKKVNKAAGKRRK